MKRFLLVVLTVFIAFTASPVSPQAEDGDGYLCFSFEEEIPREISFKNASGAISAEGASGKGLFVSASGGMPSMSVPFLAEAGVDYSFRIWAKTDGALSFYMGGQELSDITSQNGEDGWVQYAGSHRFSENGTPSGVFTVCGDSGFLVDDCIIFPEKYKEPAIRGNLVFNGSFETDLNGWEWSANSEVTRLNDGANGSGSSICTKVKSDWGCAKTLVDVRYGRKYKISWYAKAISDDADGLDMKYIFDRSQTRTDERTPPYNVNTVGKLTKEWQRFEVVHQELDSTPDKCPAHLYFRAGAGTETVSFAVDEIVIEEVEGAYEVATEVTVSGGQIGENKITAAFGKKGSAVGFYYRFLKPVGEGYAVLKSGFTDQTAVDLYLPEGFTGQVRVEVNAVDAFGIVGKTFFSIWKPKELTMEERLITNIQEQIWTGATKTLHAEALCRGEGNGKTLTAAFAVYDNKNALVRVEMEDVENVAGNGCVMSVSVGGEDCRAKFMLFDKDQFAPVKDADELVKTDAQNILYVDAAYGRDFNSGTAEKPLKTLSGAKVKVRDMLKTAKEDIYVVFREGTYYQMDPVTFRTGDSSGNVKVAYVSEKKGGASINGGREITGFSLCDPEKNIYRAYVGTEVETRQLFVDGIRATRARSRGKLENAVNLGPEGVGFTTTDTSILDYRYIQDLEFVFYEEWTNSYCGVDSVFANEGGTVTVAMEPVGWKYQWNKGNCLPSVPEYIENALELLDEEGEWYLDRHEGFLYYKPRVFEDMSAVRVTMPVCQEMLNIAGSSAFDPIRNLEFRGFVFENTTWNAPSGPGGFCCGQNNSYTGGEEQFIPGAVHVENATNVSFLDCRFARLGMTGLKMTGGLKNCRVVGNEFYDISGGALVVGDVAKNDAHNPADPAFYVENIDVTDNYMHKIAVDYKGGAALSAGFPINSRINNNEIYDTCYSGLHLGWGWNSYTKTVTEDFSVKQNYIHKVMNTKIYDGGGVYFLGRTNGSAAHPNVFSENYLYDSGNCYGMIYPDNGSTNWDITNNVVDLSKNPIWYRNFDKTPENAVMPARWLHIHMDTITDILLDNNYTTTDENLNRGIYNVRVQNLHVYSSADWPAEALDIIENAGVTPEYSDNFRYGLQEVETPSEMKLAAGETAQLAMAVQTGKEKLYHSANYEVFTTSSDENVVAVNGQTMTGKNTGTAEITVYVKEADILQTNTITVTVQNLS